MKRVITALLFSILILIIGYAVYELVSTLLPYRRARLFENPEPVPWFFDAVWPKPGNSLSLGEFHKYIMGGPCFEVSDDGLLGISFEEAGFSDKMSLLINGIPPAEYPVEGPKGGPTIWTPLDRDTRLVCWSAPLGPGNYLVEVHIEGVIPGDYAWAFRITE